MADMTGSDPPSSTRPDAEEPEDLTPDLSSISVSFAEALLQSADLIADISGKVLGKAVEEHGECEEGLRTLLATVRKQLGLEREGDGVGEVDAARVCAAAAGGEPRKKWFEDVLRGLLEAYLSAEAARASEEALPGTVQAAATTLSLVCRFASGQELAIGIGSDSTLGEVKAKLGQAKRLHVSLFRLISREGHEVELGGALVTEAFPDLVAQVLVSPEVFQVGDRVEAAWSGATDTSGFAFRECLCGGQVKKAWEQDGVANYDILWDVVDGHRTQSIVRCENSLWRTAHGGVIYSLTKCPEGALFATEDLSSESE